MAALIVSLGTYAADSQTFVFFGILHLLSVCTLLGLLIYRLPAVFLITLGLLIVIGKPYLVSEYFQPKYLAWIGLYPGPTGSADFYGFLPWSSAYIFGLGFAKILISKISEIRSESSLLFIKSNRKSVLQVSFFWIGRNSLIVYLIHQPIFMGLIFGYLEYL